jgi:hypothetical protein
MSRRSLIVLLTLSACTAERADRAPARPEARRSGATAEAEARPERYLDDRDLVRHERWDAVALEGHDRAITSIAFLPRDLVLGGDGDGRLALFRLDPGTGRATQLGARDLRCGFRERARRDSRRGARDGRGDRLGLAARPSGRARLTLDHRFEAGATDVEVAVENSGDAPAYGVSVTLLLAHERAAIGEEFTVFIGAVPPGGRVVRHPRLPALRGAHLVEIALGDLAGTVLERIDFTPGGPAGARSILRRALRAAFTVESPFERQGLLASLFEALLEAGDRDGALQAAEEDAALERRVARAREGGRPAVEESRRDPEDRDESSPTLRMLTVLEAARRRIAQAPPPTLSHFRDCRPGTVRVHARAEAALGDVEGALLWAEALEKPERRASALLGVAEGVRPRRRGGRRRRLAGAGRLS